MNVIEDVHNIVLEELGKIEGEKKFAGETVMVCCPFHSDGSPSCGIYTSVGMEIPLGFFHCFGCGEKGHWNKIAQKLNLREIPQWAIENAAENSVSGLNAKFLKLLEPYEVYRSVPELMKGLARNSYMDWPCDVEWRTYPGKLVRDAGGLMSMQHTGTAICFFPCKAGRNYIGGIAAYLTKQMNGTSYVNSKGTWAKDKGLFPYQLVKDVISEYKIPFIVLVEGPRDALALLSCGIPALAVLGAEQFGEKKCRLIEMLGAKFIYTMTDNDAGGAMLRNNITSSLKSSGLKLKHFKLPRDKDKRGKLIKMDPDNAPKSIIREVRMALKRNHNLTKLVPAHRLGWDRSNFV